jgi:hypothetical protein
MSIPVDTSSNYMRGQVFRDKKTLAMNFPELFDNPDFCGDEAFIFTLMKEEDADGLLLSDLVFFGADDKGIYILDGKNYIAKIPYEKIEYFFPFSVNKPDYYFPPAIPPKRAMLIEIEFRNSENKHRKITLVFTDLALREYELDYPSENVHGRLFAENKKNKFISDEPSNGLLELRNIVGGNFIPNEINKNKCTIDYYLGS